MKKTLRLNRKLMSMIDNSQRLLNNIRPNCSPRIRSHKKKKNLNSKILLPNPRPLPNLKKNWRITDKLKKNSMNKRINKNN